ncbi:hypothetical protein ACEPAH_1077 [Sanghuangporus vaninii]
MAPSTRPRVSVAAGFKTSAGMAATARARAMTAGLQIMASMASSSRAGISATAGLKIAPRLAPTARTGVTVTPLGQTVMVTPARTRTETARFDTRATGMTPSLRSGVSVTANLEATTDMAPTARARITVTARLELAAGVAPSTGARIAMSWVPGKDTNRATTPQERFTSLNVYDRAACDNAGNLINSLQNDIEIWEEESTYWLCRDGGHDRSDHKKGKVLLELHDNNSYSDKGEKDCSLSLWIYWISWTSTAEEV